MIWSVLDKRLTELFAECSHLLATVEKIEVVEELGQYREWVVDEISKLQADAQDLVVVVSHRYFDTLPEIRSAIQQRRRQLKLLRDRLVGPLARSRPDDRMTLQILGWLHGSTKATRNITFAVADGPFSTWPFLTQVAVYFGPMSGASDIRHKSLFCHEFGHVLYASRARQLDVRVGQLQKAIEAELTPRSVRNDARSHAELRSREKIVRIWYQWSQEFFCDAVGLTIAGPSYLNAFSSHLQLLGVGDFPSHEDFDGSTHPPTRLRIELLVERARRLELAVDSGNVLQEWEEISSSVGFDDDYLGFFTSGMSAAVHACVDDMLLICEPYRFTPADLEPCSVGEIAASNPIRLMNTAWHIYERNHEEFRVWEQGCARHFVADAV